MGCFGDDFEAPRDDVFDDGFLLPAPLRPGFA